MGATKNVQRKGLGKHSYSVDNIKEFMKNQTATLIDEGFELGQQMHTGAREGKLIYDLHNGYKIIFKFGYGERDNWFRFTRSQMGMEKMELGYYTLTIRIKDIVKEDGNVRTFFELIEEEDDESGASRNNHYTDSTILHSIDHYLNYLNEAVERLNEASGYEPGAIQFMLYTGEWS